MKDKTLKAGAIIMSSKNTANIGLIYRFKQNDWSFPKGHIEQGENAAEAMKREVYEETGLIVKIVHELPDHLYTNLKDGEIITKMFLVVSENDSNLRPEFEKDAIEWVSYDRVNKKLSYDNLKEYFKSVLPIIEKYIN